MKTAIITGAGRGIGRAIALRFAADGVNIVANYVGDRPDDEFVGQIEAFGVQILPYECDVRDFDRCGEMIADAQKHFGSIEYLINNAGITRDGLILKMKENDFDDCLDVNLKGAFNTTRHISGIMAKQREGAIVNIASVVGIRGNAGQANYAASKAGLIGLTKSVARELGGRGITVNAVAPGFIDTDMTAKLSDSIKAKFLEQIPLGRYGTPDEVAEVVFFAANCKYLTGQVIAIDGGMI